MAPITLLLFLYYVLVFKKKKKKEQFFHTWTNILNFVHWNTYNLKKIFHPNASFLIVK